MSTMRRSAELPAVNWMRTWVSGQCDTIVDRQTGIHIHTQETGIPPEWTKPPCSAVANLAGQTAAFHAAISVVEALNSYPSELLRAFLGKVYILQDLKMNNRDFGATCVGPSIYICVGAQWANDLGEWTKNCFHHEFAHGLWNRLPHLFKATIWRTYNPPGFIYDHRSLGEGGLDDDPKLYSEGFVCKYGKATMQEDMCTLTERLFRADPKFLKNLPKYPLLAQKARLLDDFYSQVAPKHTWPWTGQVPTDRLP